MVPAKAARNQWIVAASAVAAIGLSMIIAFTLTLALYPDEWLPAEAEVIATRIESSREGTLSWNLNADIFYEIDGTRYERSDYKILHQSLREDTVERQREWPAGKRFVVYVESDDPNAISLSPDGDREALAVVLALLTPAFIIAVALLSVLLVRRVLAARHGTGSTDR
jgi:hypothetical protein